MYTLREIAQSMRVFIDSLAFEDVLCKVSERVDIFDLPNNSSNGKSTSRVHRISSNQGNFQAVGEV